MFHWLLSYLGFRHPARTLAAEKCIDAAFASAKEANPTLWAKPSSHAPTRQAKFELFCLTLAHRYPKNNPALQREVLEGAIERLEIGLREAGISDVAIARQVRTHAAALHGRLDIYTKLIEKNKIDNLIKVSSSHGITLQEVKLLIKNPLPKAKKTVKR